MYVDGFVLPVRKKNLAKYLRMARLGCKAWMEHGAVAYCEAVGDDLKVKSAVPFPKMARCKPGETVFFSWIVYRSKAHRNAVNKKVMKDPRLLKMMGAGPHPFDYRRMAMGGFRVVVTS